MSKLLLSLFSVTFTLSKQFSLFTCNFSISFAISSYMRTSEKNRFTNALTVGNCKLDMVFSDIFGKTSSAIINTILSQNEYNDEDILKNIHKNCKSSNEDILNSISGISWQDAQKQRMNVIQEHIDYLDKSIKTVREIIDSIIAPYESAINLLCSVPGVDRNSAITIIPDLLISPYKLEKHCILPLLHLFLSQFLV